MNRRFHSRAVRLARTGVATTLLAVGLFFMPVLPRSVEAGYLLTELPVPQPSLGDRHGASLSIAGSGEVIIAGASADSYGGVIRQGSAVVFRRDTSGWVVDSVLVDPTPSVEAEFGNSVAIDVAGDTAIVGGNAGRAVIFQRDAYGWQTVGAIANDCGPSSDGRELRRSVAVSGDGTVAAASCQAGILLTDIPSDGLGATQFVNIPGAVIPSHQYPYWAVDLSDNGQVLVASNPQRGPGGSISIFRRSAGVWEFDTELFRTSASAGEDLGYEVQISDDGTVVTATAAFLQSLLSTGDVAEGGVQTWVWESGSWNELPVLRPPYSDPFGTFGAGIAASGDGQDLFVSYGISGRWFHYTRTPAGWASVAEMPEAGWVIAAGSSRSHLAVASPYATSQTGRVWAVNYEPPAPPPPTDQRTDQSFASLSPSRVLDTRPSNAKVGNADGSGAPLVLKVLGQGGVPTSGVSAVALNVTVTQTEDPTLGGGYVTVYPCGTRPDASNLNFVGGQTIPNSVIAPVSADGEVCFYVYGTAHLLADVSGYFPT